MIATAKQNGHGLVRLTFNDGRPVMEVPADWPELAAWADQPGNSIAEVDAPTSGALIQAVKAEAARRILLVAPEYMQRNLTARAAELALTYPGLGFDDLPEPEKTEAAAGRTIWLQIKAIREKSAEVEAAVTGLSEAARRTFDVADDAHWEI